MSSLPEFKLDDLEFGYISGLSEVSDLLKSHFEPLNSCGWNLVVSDSRTEPILRFVNNLSQGINSVFCPPGFSEEDAIAIANEINPAYLNKNGGFAAFLSSGSTGKPKVVIHSYSNLISAAKKVVNRYPEIEGAKLHHLFPSHYMAGLLNCTLVPWVAGGSIFLDRLFDFKAPYTVGESIRDHSTEYAWLSPNMVQSISEAWKSKLGTPSLWDIVLSATGPLFTKSRDEFERTFKSRVLNTYGSTELLFISSELRRDREVSAGGFFPGVIHRINSKDEETLKNGGVLEIKSDSSATGIAKFNKKNNVYEHEFLSQDEFFETNDLVEFDDETRLKVLGRVDDVVVLGGVNYNLTEIEEVATSYPGVTASCAFAPFGGVPSDLHLVFETHGDNLDFSLEEFMNFMARTLGDSRPRRLLHSTVARTHNGKIDRQQTMTATLNGAQL